MVVVETMPQLMEAHNPTEDWTGVTSATVRRRLQNRLNQRAHRRRKQADVEAAQHYYLQHWDIDGQQRNGYMNEQMALRVVAGGLMLVCPVRRERVHSLARKAYEDYSIRSPRPSNLSTLIRINILNAVARNASALGFPVEGLCHDDFISPFNQLGPHVLNSPILSCPASLRPTELQLAVTHHPWIDLFPVPRMRDNVLSAVVAGLIDEDELCADLVNTDEGHTERPTLIVWGESWDPLGWEATVPFLRKWGWLTRGCPEIWEATNTWRETRGEKRLVFGAG